MKKPKKNTARKVGRDAKTGRFMSLPYVPRSPTLTAQETLQTSKPKKGK
jgi:hypothetical protein